jgi:hypothetical protein
MASENASSSTESESKPGRSRSQSAIPPMPTEVSDNLRVSEEAVRKAGNAYRESSEFATDRINALLSAYAVLANGAQEIQRTYLEVLQHSMEVATAGQREFLHCKNLSDVAELQRDLLRKNIDEWLEGGSKLLRVSGRIAEDAVRPIEDRIGHAA